MQPPSSFPMDNELLAAAAGQLIPSTTTTTTTTSLLLLLLTIFFLTILAKIQRSSQQKSQLPPGPWRLPIIGNLHQLLVSQPPHRRLMDLAGKYGPLMYLQLGETSNVVVSSPEMAKEILKTHDLSFANRPVFPVARILSYGARDIAFSPYGSFYKHMRKVASEEILGKRRVKSLRPVMEAEVAQVIASVRSSKVVNLSLMLDALGNTLISRAVFGKMMKKPQEEFLAAKEELLVAFAGFGLGNFFPSSKLIRVLSGSERAATKLHKRMDVMLESILTEHMAKRKSRPLGGDQAAAVAGEDFLDVLLNLTEKNDQELGFSITTVEIKAIILDFFLGSSDTSSGIIEWVMSELMRHPRVMEKVKTEVRETFDDKKGTIDEAGIEELTYMKAVVMETLRLHPILPLLVPRQCGEALVIAGYHIPEKTTAMVNLLAIGRDPRHWTDPENFYPERFVDRYNGSNPPVGTCFDFLPFGAGRRMCPGVLFGTTVLELTLANLLYHFDWKLPDDGTIDPRDLDMSEFFGVTLRRKNNLHLVPVPYYYHPK